MGFLHGVKIRRFNWALKIFNPGCLWIARSSRTGIVWAGVSDPTMANSKAAFNVYAPISQR